MASQPPAPDPGPAAAPIGQILAKPRLRRTLGWWIVSITLHLAAVGAVIYFTPLRQWLFDPAPPDDSMPRLSQAEIDRLAGVLNESYLRKLKESAEKLSEAGREMDRLQLKRFEKVRSSEPKLVDVTPDSLAALPAPPAASEATVLTLYDYCAALEKALFARYERLRAYDLAGQQFVPVSEALRATQIARPERQPINAQALTARLTTLDDGRFDALKRELSTADAEAKSMVATADRMLALAKGLLGEDSTVGVLQWELAGAQANTGAGEMYEEGAPYVGPQLLPNERFESSGTRMGNVHPAFGRKLGDNGAQADWLSIDTWYIVGPFTHPGRADLQALDKKYPPESVLDLDATYIGKGGKPLSWKYRQRRMVRFEPYGADVDKYAIYYAYTEIASDRDRTVWMAFGSDDYAKVWVEGKLIWTSGKTPHPWIPDRGFRKVFLKQGITRIMLRLENAGGTTGFSVLINLDPNVK